MKKLEYFIMIGGIAIMAGAGCSTVQSSLIGGATSGLGAGIGRAASARVEQGVYNRLAPKTQLPQPNTPGWNQFMTIQAQMVFNYSFSVGGFWFGTTAYRPGDWTKFEFKSKDDAAVLLERAFLKRTDDGREWWRVSWTDEGQAMIYEALMTAEGQLLRLRAKDSNGNEGEIPVTEGSAVLYTPPAELTKESIQGASVGKETVKTSAGDFLADHIKYMSMGSDGAVEFWITDAVPGGAVKYQISDKTEGTVWTCTLKEKGDNATTVLKSF